MHQSTAVALGLLCVMLIVLCLDMGILWRWLAYQTKLNQFRAARKKAPQPEPVPDVPLFDPAVETVSAVDESAGSPLHASVDAPHADSPFAIPEVPPIPSQDPEEMDIRDIAEMHGIVSPFARKWSMVHPFVGMQAALGIVGVLQIVAFIPLFMMQGMESITSTPGMAVIAVTLFIQNAAFVAVAAYCLNSYGLDLKSVGFARPSGKEIRTGIVLGVTLLLAATAAEKGLEFGMSHILSNAALKELTDLNNSITAGGLFEKVQSTPVQILFALGGAIAAPIGEELFFRGLLYNGLKNRWGIRVAVLGSALCFAITHLGPIAVAVIIPMGIILALAYEKTKSLWVTIIMHGIHNGATFALAMYAMNHHQ